MDKLLQAKHMATVLASSFRERDVEITHGQSLDIVARQLGAKDWNALSAKLKRSVPTKSTRAHIAIPERDQIAPTDFREFFPEAELPPGFLEAGTETRHPFPRELKAIPELASWRECWEANARSTHDRHFFPPMLPASSLMSARPTYELRRDWRIGPDGKAIPTEFYHFSDGFCCVFAKDDKGGQVVGAAFWKWWGNHGRVNGVCYGLYLLTDGGWLHVVFDIRANHPFPTAGPLVTRGDTVEHTRDIKAGLRQLSKLKVFRYAS